jgi:hypothetical protein
MSSILEKHRGPLILMGLALLAIETALAIAGSRRSDGFLHADLNVLLQLVRITVVVGAIWAAGFLAQERAGLADCLPAACLAFLPLVVLYHVFEIVPIPYVRRILGLAVYLGVISTVHKMKEPARLAGALVVVLLVQEMAVPAASKIGFHMADRVAEKKIRELPTFKLK